MGDIVKDLRSIPSSLNDAMRTMEVGADEIERLTAERDAARRRNYDNAAESERLTEALSQAYEECAKVPVEWLKARKGHWPAGGEIVAKSIADSIAAAIRSRGQE